MDKLLIITPHLSTGGAPQFTLNKIELLKNSYEIYCVEYSFVSPHYVVQRNKIIDLLGDNFKSLGENKDNLLNIINEINPNIISLEEFGETFIRQDILDKIYSNNRNYKILESTHSSHDNSNIKRWLPDKFIFVSEWSQKMYSHFEVDSEVIEYPVDKKIRDQKSAQKKLNLDPSYKHVLNVGLFTPGKNQGYAFDIARNFKDEKVLFHFIGNQAPNFKGYWEPIMRNKPDNCIVWGERDDVDTFIQASDLFLFTSKFELNPLVIKEVLCYEDIPIMMFNLETYMGNYDSNKNIKFISGDIKEDIRSISNNLSISSDGDDNGDDKEKDFEYSNKNREEVIPLILKSNNLNGIGVEIGVFKGQFSKHILENWNGTLYMVDPWRELDNYIDDSNHSNHPTAYSEAMNSIKGYEDRAIMIRSLSNQAYNLFEDESLDFIYIDGNHSYESVKEDLNLWFPKLKKGGLFAGHDYLRMDWNKPPFAENGIDKHIWMWPSDNKNEQKYAGIFGVNPAVDEFCKEKGIKIDLTKEWTATWLFIK